MQNLSYENKFDLHENEPVGGIQFQMNGFTRRHLGNRHLISHLDSNLSFRHTGFVHIFDPYTSHI